MSNLRVFMAGLIIAVVAAACGGVGAEAMKPARGRVFDQHGAQTVVIDPAVDNRWAIAF